MGRLDCGPKFQKEILLFPLYPLPVLRQIFSCCPFSAHLKVPSFLQQGQKATDIHGEKVSWGQIRTAGLQLQILASFSLWILRLSLEFLPAQQCIWKDISHMLSSVFICFVVEILGTPLQYSCLENPMDRGAW